MRTRALVLLCVIAAGALLVPAAAGAAEGSADLSVTVSRTPHVAQAGVTEVTYTATVANDGPDPATGVVLVDPWSTAPAEVRSATPSQGSCGVRGQFVTCRLGTLASGASATVVVVVVVHRSGAIQNPMTVTSDVADPDPSNDTGSALLLVEPGPTYVERVVTGYFTEVLGRAPTEAELETWGTLFQQPYPVPCCSFYNPTGTPFTRKLVGTNTFKLREIATISERYLGGPAGPSLRRIFLQWLNSGRTIDHVTAHVAGSSQYFAVSGGTDGGFVNALVRELTGAAPDSAWRRGLLARLDGGASRASVAMAVVRDGRARSWYVRNAFERYLLRPPTDFELFVHTLGVLGNDRPHELDAYLLTSYEVINRFIGPYCCEE